MQTSAAMGKMSIQNVALNNLCTLVAVVMILINNVVLNKDMDCNCDGGRLRDLSCSFYILMPAIILVLFQLWMEKTLLHTCTCREKRCTFYCCHTCTTVLKALAIGMLWVVSVLIDGDWAACCFDSAKLRCMLSTDIKSEHKSAIAELKNKSLVIGLSFLVALVLAAFLAPFCGRSERCKGKSRDVMYERCILEEGDKVLEEILRKSAKEKLTTEIKEKIDGEDWKKCFDVVGELMNSSSKPTTEIQPDERNTPETLTVRTREEGSIPENIPLVPRNPGPSGAS